MLLEPGVCQEKQDQRYRLPLYTLSLGNDQNHTLMIWNMFRFVKGAFILETVTLLRLFKILKN